MEEIARGKRPERQGDFSRNSATVRSMTSDKSTQSREQRKGSRRKRKKREDGNASGGEGALIIDLRRCPRKKNRG